MISHLTCALANIDLKTIVLVFGTVWALYKVVQRGTLRRLLDLRVSARLIKGNEGHYLVCSMKAENVHLPVVRIEYCALQVSSMGGMGDHPELLPTWMSLEPVEVFGGHKKIRANETIQDEILLNVPNEQVFEVFFKAVAKLHWYQRPFSLLSNVPGLERFAPKRTRWYARAIVDSRRNAEVRNEGDHPGRRSGNGRGNEEVEGRD